MNNNTLKFISNQKGNSIYQSNLNDLYQRAIKMMRYKESNWIRGGKITNYEDTQSYNFGAIPFYTKSKRLFFLMTYKGLTNKDDKTSEIPLFKVKIKRATQDRYLTLIQSNSKGKKTISDTTYTNSAGTIMSGEKVEIFYSYVICDFIANENDGSQTIVDADGVPIDNRIIIEFTDNTNKTISDEFRKYFNMKIVEVGSGIDDENKVYFFDSQVIPSKMLQGIDKIQKWQLKGYTETTKYEHYNNFILYKPNFALPDFSGSIGINDKTDNLIFLQMLNQLYQDRNYDFSTIKHIALNSYDLSDDYYSDSTKKVISDRIEFESDNDNLYLLGKTLDDGDDYKWNEGKIHRATINQTFLQSEDYDDILIRQNVELFPANTFSNSLLFQHVFLDYDTDSNNNSTSNESFLLNNFFGNLNSNKHIAINNTILSYFCNMLSQPFFQLSSLDLVASLRKFEDGYFKIDVKYNDYIRVEFYDLSDVLADISIENFNSDSNHNVYMRFFY
jgi:hypothetical protein